MNALKKTKENVIVNFDSILEDLQDSIKTKIYELPEQKRQEFMLEFEKKKKSLRTAYILLALFIGPYLGYLKKWWLQLLHWLTWGGYLVWWIINIFYLPKLVRKYNIDLASKLLNDIDKPYLSSEYISKILKDNELEFVQTSKTKIVVTINEIKFSIQWKDKDIIWALVVPIEFYLMVIVLFCLLSIIIVFILSGSFGFVVLGALPAVLLSEFLYRWKPSVFRERSKFLSFLRKNFDQ